MHSLNSHGNHNSPLLFNEFDSMLENEKLDLISLK